MKGRNLTFVQYHTSITQLDSGTSRQQQHKRRRLGSTPGQHGRTLEREHMDREGPAQSRICSMEIEKVQERVFHTENVPGSTP
jgi:hypothetical protein